MSKKLTLPLKRKWFDMIKSGEKKEEYREINRYWNSRLIDKKTYLLKQLKQFDEVEFTLGYPKKSDKERRMKFSNPQIFVGKGKEKWGAEKDKLYFVIKWEE